MPQSGVGRQDFEDDVSDYFAQVQDDYISAEAYLFDKTTFHSIGMVHR